MLKPVIDSVDRFGLKAYHLRKHKDSVNRLYEALSRRDYQTEVAAGYEKRLQPNSGKLSISERCKCKGLNFLDFLQSGQVDIYSFAGGA